MIPFRISSLIVSVFAITAIGHAQSKYVVKNVEGWTVRIRTELMSQEPKATDRALKLLQVQLKEIVRVVPPKAVKHLRTVTLWFSPEYPGIQPRAEYHPGAQWLKDNGRNPEMAKGIEFTNISIFSEETVRMPNFALHELAHAYHDQVLGWNQPDIQTAYANAKASKRYDKVERWSGAGRPKTFEMAYAMTNSAEYFAESTEAFFTRNDFYPFNRAELHKHDPAMEVLLKKLWSM